MTGTHDSLIETDEERRLSPEFVRDVANALDNGDRDGLMTLIAHLHAADEADLLEILRPDERRAFIDMVGDALEFETLTELDDTLRGEILANLEPTRIAESIKSLDTDDAVFLLEDLEEETLDAILSRLPAPERATLERALDYPDESAGRLMQADFVAVPPAWTVGQTIDYMRDEDHLPKDFFEIFVVDPGSHLLGTVPLSRILRTRRPVRIEDIMSREQVLIPAAEDQEQVAHTFSQYNLVSAAVVDEARRIVGVITVDDIVDVINAESEEDIRRLAGVGDETLTDTVWSTARNRFTWLSVNLATAILASGVISLFDATISQMVALAILMPIVASMGGNAATQTMTVAVRALATRELVPFNTWRIVMRELFVGSINGILFAIIMGGIGALWFSDPMLGVIVAAAMVVNLFCAGVAGILIPIGLERAGIDPAVASSVFVTTVTDVVGFFAFLGLAALVLV